MTFVPGSRTASAAAERCAALIAAALRLVFVLQVIIGAAGAVESTRSAPAYLAFSAVVLLTSALLITQCARTGDVHSGRWRIPDLVLGFAASPVLLALIPAERFIGTWEAWAIAYSINTAVVAATWLPLRAAIVHAVVLGSWAALFSLIAAPDLWRTTVTNCLTIPGYAVVVAVFSYYLRSIAAAADRSREEAVTATRALELHRYQRTVHDATSILRMLSDEETPESVLPGLRLQAEREAARLRNYLDPATLAALTSAGAAGPPGPAGSAGSTEPPNLTVGGMIAEALQGFDDLPLELATELGADAPLSDTVWEAARGAVATVLHNVRIHAHAHQVVVHADTVGTRWEVVVSDDGAGFDQSTQRLGFGLAGQVHQALAECGAHAEVTSQPGHGTSVTLTGPIAHKDSR